MQVNLTSSARLLLWRCTCVKREQLRLPVYCQIYEGKAGWYAASKSPREVQQLSSRKSPRDGLPGMLLEDDDDDNDGEKGDSRKTR